jgi:hypothetical protein
VAWDWVHFVCRPLFGLLYQPWMIDEYGAFGGIRIGRGNQSTQRKPAPVPLCPPQIPHDLTWDRTWATAVGSQWLAAWAMAWPKHSSNWLMGDTCHQLDKRTIFCNDTMIKQTWVATISSTSNGVQELCRITFSHAKGSEAVAKIVYHGVSLMQDQNMI